MPLAWILNFDAENELADRPRTRVPFTGRPGWIGDGDVVLDAAVSTGAETAGLDGAAWCPVPSAIERLLAAGVRRLPVAPGFDVLRAANARETFADLHPLVRFGACTARTAAEVEQAVRRRPPSRPSTRPPAWWLRESLCAAGQGRFLAERWTAEAAAWTDRALVAGPIHVLPVVDIDQEFSAHAYLYSSGETLIGRHVEQTVRGGSWRSAEPSATSLPVLGAALETVVARLRTMGYVGPVGVDGFAWRDAEGRSHLAAGTDVNARYTMSMRAAFELLPLELAPDSD